MRPRHEPDIGDSTASVGYGILVNAHGLIMAAKGFATFSTDVFSLDLLVSRRRRSLPVLSTLAPPPNASLTTLPLSILLLIRDQLLELHLEAAPHRFLDEHITFFTSFDDIFGCFCSESYDGCSCADREALLERNIGWIDEPGLWDEDLWELHDELECPYCRKVVPERLFFHQEGSTVCERERCEASCEETTMAQIERLLRAYGLAINTPFLTRPGYTGASQIRAAITLPTRFHPPSLPPGRSPPPEREPLSRAHSYIQTLQTYKSEIYRTTIFDASVFSITPDDNARFTRFIRDFRLYVADPNAGGGGTISAATLEENLDAGESESEQVGTSGADNGAGSRVKATFLLLHSIAPNDWEGDWDMTDWD